MVQISYSIRDAKEQKDLSALCTIPTPSPLSDFQAARHPCPSQPVTKVPRALPTPPVSNRLLSNASYRAFTEHLQGYRVDFVTKDTELFTAIANFRPASTEKSQPNPPEVET